MNCEKIEKPKGYVVVDDSKIETAAAEMTSANILEVEVGTTGYCGGDSGHGGRTYLRLKDLASTDMRCKVKGYDYSDRQYKDVDMTDANSIEITFGGDCELDTFIAALEFAVDKLKEQAGGVYTMSVAERRRNNFRWYLCDLMTLYASTGKLDGMGKVRDEHHVTGITKQQFFECRLDDASRENTLLPQEYCDKVYDYVLGRLEAAPRWTKEG